MGLFGVALLTVSAFVVGFAAALVAAHRGWRWARLATWVDAVRPLRERARRFFGATPGDAPATPPPALHPDGPAPTDLDALAGPRAASGSSRPPSSSVIPFDPIAPRGTTSTSFDEHGEAWRIAMAQVGARLRTANVCAAIFVHGTFVGADPLSIVRLARRTVPRFGPLLERAFRRKTQAHVSALLGDLGTFGDPYVGLFERGVGHGISCTRFAWSSENHHLGRLEGAIGLARVVAVHAKFAEGRGAGRPRVLLVGHSHGGQLFALLTHLLMDGAEADVLLDIARSRGVSIDGFRDVIEQVRACELDVVTQGTPARYPWLDVPNFRVMHIVNQGSEGARGIRPLLGLDGDTIRRLGASGSDLPATTRAERELNARLDPVLGPGSDALALLRGVRGGVRVDAAGHTYLVDYDAGEAAGILTTGAGHGVYTRVDAMLFTARLIADHFYPAEPAADAAPNPRPRSWWPIRPRRGAPR